MQLAAFCRWLDTCWGQIPMEGFCKGNRKFRSKGRCCTGYQRPMQLIDPCDTLWTEYFQNVSNTVINVKASNCRRLKIHILVSERLRNQNAKCSEKNTNLCKSRSPRDLTSPYPKDCFPAWGIRSIQVIICS